MIQRVDAMQYGIDEKREGEVQKVRWQKDEFGWKLEYSQVKKGKRMHCISQLIKNKTIKRSKYPVTAR